MTGVPLVSVICICHNCTHLLPMAAASLRAQTWPAWECIVVDDGSEDSPAEVVAQMRDERMTVVRLEANRGRGYARHYAQRHVQGELVAFLDADDWWYPTKLERQVAYLEAHPQAGLVGTGLAVVDARGALLGLVKCTSFESAPGISLVPRLGFATLCVRKPVLDRSPFDPSYRIAEDREWLVRTLRREQYANIGLPLYAYYENRAESVKRYWGTSAANLRTFARRLGDAPRQALRQSLLTVGKAAAYSAAAAVRQPGLVARHHRAPASAETVAAHARALATVLGERARLFDASECCVP